MFMIAAFGVILISLSFWVFSVQRYLIGMDESIRSAMAQIGMQISVQWEVLASLLDLTEWYAAPTHGCETIIETMTARRSITMYSFPDDVRKQEKIIGETIREFKEVAEIYPDLKEDPNYIKTMDALHQYENMVQRSLLIYMDKVTRFDRAVHMFPNSLFAGILGFSNHAYLNFVER